MAEIAKSGVPSVSTPTPDASHRLSGLISGDTIGAGDACYVNSAGAVMRATGAAANTAAQVHGWAAQAAAVGESITLLFNVGVRYAAALTPGTRYYLSGTVAGGIADAASTGGTAPIAFAIDATRIWARQSQY